MKPRKGPRYPLFSFIALVLTSGACLISCSDGDVEAGEVRVTVDPKTVALAPFETRQFTASVTGATDTGVLWSVVEPDGGSITGGGLYTAPEAEGTFQVKATSVEDGDASDTATVTVSNNPPAVTVAISPKTATVEVTKTQQFLATVTGTANTAVTWEVQEQGGGSIDADGLYTAPAVEGAYHVVATSQADVNKSDSATVEVTPGGSCTDDCPAPEGGVTWECKKRFMFGINWAWRNWAGDFGGISAWGWAGVDGASADYSDDMAQMKAAGVSVIRWWMFPRFLTESINWDADDTPSGIGGTLVADIHKALELAEQHDVYLMLTPFSFDNFRSTRDESGVYSRGIRPMVVETAKRQKLLDNLVKPVAQAVEASPYKQRMIAWDMINEPEWAIAGPNMYGGEDFTPNGELQSVTHAQMETFLQEMAAVLRANSTALITVGNSAIKWGTAWTRVDQDFYSLHYYDWVYEWFPYDTVTLESVGLDDKPVVMGEFPIQGLSAVGGNPARTLAQMMTDLWNLGYAGGLAWAYNDGSFPWNPQTVKSFSDLHPCETAY